MQYLKAISEDEMVAVFLKTEITSRRLVPTIMDILCRDGRDRRIIDNPDISREEDNAYRRRVLGDYRGFQRDAELFRGFPATVQWFRAIITKDILARVRYIDYAYWVALSGGSRLASDAAARIQQGVEVFGVSNAGFWHVADAIKAATPFPEMIMVGLDK